MLLRMRAFAIFALAALLGCGRSTEMPGTGRGVLVVAIDGLRADHLSGAGYDRETTPVLDVLARQSARFVHAYAAAPQLLPAHVGILTGCDPAVARRVLPEGFPATLLTTWHVPEQAPSLAREFLVRGYSTACFADDPVIAPVYGFSTGFEEFQACEIDDETRLSDIGIEGVSTHFEQWLKNRGKNENWFAYLHLHDLVRAWHYDDPERDTFFAPRPELSAVPPVSVDEQAFFALPRHRWGGIARTLGEYEARYDGALRKVDRLLGRMFAHMKQIGRYDKTTIVVVGTYGTGFGESGLYLDSGRLADVDLHVPWILRPGSSVAGIALVEARPAVSLIDLAPTLLGLEEIATPETMHGQSLALYLRGQGAPRGYAVASCGVQEGWAICDEHFCFERVYPGRAERKSLVESWFGDDELHPDELREVLHDRRIDPTLGHLRTSSTDAEARARLFPVGMEWTQRIDKQRRRWQSKSWTDDFVGQPASDATQGATGASDGNQ